MHLITTLLTVEKPQPLGRNGSTKENGKRRFGLVKGALISSVKLCTLYTQHASVEVSDSSNQTAKFPLL